ncbi:hypothetical protein K1719_015074 [Acacia pycnantha]|nr:hypothetical protein K1719_015074 [Acacia pycnantha]
MEDGDRSRKENKEKNLELKEFRSLKYDFFNHLDANFEEKVGDKIAQLIIERIVMLEVEEVEDLDSTTRGEGGFGPLVFDLLLVGFRISISFWKIRFRGLAS